LVKKIKSKRRKGMPEYEKKKKKYSEKKRWNIMIR
jgi:hypothetical protein